MNERILNALMRLFGMLANAEGDSHQEASVVESFLSKHLNKEQTRSYLATYNGLLKEQRDSFKGGKKNNRLSINSVKAVLICNQINRELTRRQKFVLLMKLIEFVNSKGGILDHEKELINTVGYCFHISDEELSLCIQFCTKQDISEIHDSLNILTISENKPTNSTTSKHLHCPSLSGEICVLRLSKIGIFFARYIGNNELLLNGQLVLPDKIYTISHGSSFHNSKIQSIYYSDIVGCFFNELQKQPTVFEAKNISYQFKNGTTGLHPLNLHERSGKLIGIMGGSGAGKSTLLNILNGNITPSSGEVLINGLNVHTERNRLDGEIGYVPQDDLLIEELTVYQNLFFNAKLSLPNQSDAAIAKVVIDLLNTLGLLESKKLKVGSPLENIISGGQRKRLNIALELIREPSVLFLDEPTSGLSSRDSENIMDLLKELSLKGKLVFVVIHQPSSEIFKMFDKLMILDTGGYPAYYGNPVESVIYFKSQAQYVNANESECITCGNVNPEQVFNIIETKVLDENGYQTTDRRVSPAEWNEIFNQNFKTPHFEKSLTPKTENHKKQIKPSYFKQFQIFILRDIYSKITNIQYLTVNFLQAPLLALILATMVKYYKKNEEYIFAENKNLPAYLFMSVLVSLFVGLMVSAEEIIRDRKILKRESFLNLSRGAYLLSKIMLMLLISAIQTLSFVLIGNHILEIQSMNLSYWLILFSTSVFANMLGLNISSGFNSVVTIYILIPFLLIPQILLSGVLVKFQDLNPKISSPIMVPIEGDLMASRWAFEALAVNQFMNNPYEKFIYKHDKKKSFSNFMINEWESKMNNLANDVLMAKSWPSVSNNSNEKMTVITNEIIKEEKRTPHIKFGHLKSLSFNTYNEKLAEKIYEYLSKIKKHYIKIYKDADDKKEHLIQSLSNAGGSQAIDITKLRIENENERLSNLVKNITMDDGRFSEIYEGEIIALKDPIYRPASGSHFIRSHFFAPEKYVFGKYIDTYWVNLSVLWAMSLLLWATLYFDLLRKSIGLFSNTVKTIKTRKKEK